MKKRGRTPKYKTEEERKAAHKISGRLWAEKNRRKKGLSKKRGRPFKYKTEKERKAAIYSSNRKWLAKQKGNSVGKKIGRPPKYKTEDERKAGKNTSAKKLYQQRMAEAKAFREGVAVPQAQTPAPATDASALARIEALEKENSEMKKDMEMICTDLTKLEKLVKWPQAGASK
jgi:hypothetical protein